MRTIKIFKTFTLFILTSLTFVPVSAADEQLEIPIGAILPLTGNTATFSVEATRAIKIFESADYNKKYRFKFILEDGQCGIGSSASTAAHNLIEQKKVEAIFTGCSGEVLQIAPIAEKAEVIVMGVISGSPDIKNAGQYIYRTCPDLSQGAFITAEYLNSKNLDKVAILTETNSYTVSIKNELIKFLDKKIVFAEDFAESEINYRSILLKSKSLKPKAYYLNMASPTAYQNILKQVKQMGIQEPIFTFNSPQDKSSLKNLGDLQEGVIFFSTPDIGNTTADYEDFIATYKKSYPNGPEMPFWLLTAYNGLKALTEMVIETSNDSSKFRDYLDNSGIKGALGQEHFDKNGDLLRSKYVLKQIKNGKPTILGAE